MTYICWRKHPNTQKPLPAKKTGTARSEKLSVFHFSRIFPAQSGPGDRDHKGMIDIDLLDW